MRKKIKQIVVFILVNKTVERGFLIIDFIFQFTHRNPPKADEGGRRCFVRNRPHRGPLFVS
jgi:hypothetical protein